MTLLKEFLNLSDIPNIQSTVWIWGWGELKLFTGERDVTSYTNRKGAEAQISCSNVAEIS